MNNEFENSLNNNDLEDENNFLKMKLMLEKGAIFGKVENKEIPPEIEHEFLINIIEFEKQYNEEKTIRVFDKIEKPVHFKPVAEIPDEAIDKAWEELSNYLEGYSINLYVCSPNISNKELYRFVTEELFEEEMIDMDIPGMMHEFTYDEFHPDWNYENTLTATEECMKYILQKEPMEWTHHFRKNNLQLNQHSSLTEEEFLIIVNMFKLAYDDLAIEELNDLKCIVNPEESWVSGTYSVLAFSGKESCMLSGKWKVVFEKDESIGYWYINNVQVEGINF